MTIFENINIDDQSLTKLPWQPKMARIMPIDEESILFKCQIKRKRIYFIN